MSASDPDLFDVKRHRKPAPKPPATDGAVQRLLGQYVDAYIKRFDERPVITKKDGALLKRLIVAYGPETVAARLKLYLAWDDPFVVRSAWSIGVLYVKWGELTARAKPPRQVASVPDAEKTLAYLRTMRGGKK